MELIPGHRGHSEIAVNKWHWEETCSTGRQFQPQPPHFLELLSSKSNCQVFLPLVTTVGTQSRLEGNWQDPHLCSNPCTQFAADVNGQALSSLAVGFDLVAAAV